MKRKFFAYAPKTSACIMSPNGMRIRLCHTNDIGMIEAYPKRFQRLPQFDYEVDIVEEDIKPVPEPKTEEK